MKYACEIMAEVIAKKKAEEERKRVEEEASRLAKLAMTKKAMEEFQKNIEEIDAYVEKELIKGEGRAELMIDERRFYCEGFWCFVKKDYRYSKVSPYWENKRMTETFPLEPYIEHLREHCFTVEKIRRPFTGYSSNFKQKRNMEGITLKISI